MALAGPWWIPVLGWQVQGDLAGITIYTSHRKKLVWFPKSPPKVRPSLGQQVTRSKFTQASFAWWALTPAKRADWMRAADAARLRIHGYNLFVYWSTKKDNPTIETIERQTGISLI